MSTSHTNSPQRRRTPRIASCAAALAVALVPSIGSAQLGGLLCAEEGTAGRVVPGIDLHRVTIDTSDFPLAVCNDGSPAVMFVREGRNRHRDKWFVYLQGGGGCPSADACAERWCHTGGQPFGADKMSSQMVPSSIFAGGIFDRRRSNYFSNWTHVFVYACSSDNWLGDAEHVLTTTVQVRDHPPGVEFPIHFRGVETVRAAFATLQREPDQDPVEYVDETGAIGELPDLDDATHVLFGGSGVGSQGLRYHVDAVGAALRAANPSVDYRAVFDAGVTPAIEDLDFSATPFPSYNEAIRDRWENLFAFWGAQPHAEESCLAYHDPSWDRHLCSDATHVLQHHVRTPFFAREDVLDDNAAPGYPHGRPDFPDYDFAILAHQMLTNLRYIDHTAEEGSFRSGLDPTLDALTRPGVFGPQCGEHVAIRLDQQFFDVTIPRPDAKGREPKSMSYHDTLSSWIRNRDIQANIVPMPELDPTLGRVRVLEDCP